MRSVNKVILIGNVTRDPEMRQTGNGQSVVTFGLATNREWVTRDARKQSSAEFHELVAWAKLADICSKFLKKGKLIYVEGYLKTRSWDTPEGTKKFKTEIVVQDLIMLDKRQNNESGEDYTPDDNAQMGDSMGGNMDSEPAPEKVQAPAIKRVEHVAPKPTPEPASEPTTKTENSKISIDDDLGL